MRFLLLTIAILMSACDGESQTATPVQAPPPPVQVPEPGPVVFIGDSITAGWTFPPEREYVNAGASGQWSQLMQARFDDEVMSLNPSVVHILAGTNDVRIYHDPSMDAVISMAERAAASGACVILGTIPPNEVWGVGVDAERGNINITNWNSRIRDLAAERGYLLADYHPLLALPDGSVDWTYSYDGIHPNAIGHEKMLEVAEPLIDECLSTDITGI
jgi:lysophospholipase L1-like esterase